MKGSIVAVLLVSLLLFGCTQTPPPVVVPSATPAAVASVEASATPEAAIEPAATAEATPGATPTPIPTEMPSIPAYITSTPSAPLKTNFSVKLWEIRESLENAVNEVFSNLSDKYPGVEMTMSDYNEIGAKEFFADAEFLAPITVAARKISQLGQFRIVAKYAPNPPKYFYMDEKSYNGRKYYSKISSDYFAGEFEVANSSSFFCGGGSYQAFLFMDKELSGSIAEQTGQDPTEFVTRKLMDACPE